MREEAKHQVSEGERKNMAEEGEWAAGGETQHKQKATPESLIHTSSVWLCVMSKADTMKDLF